MEARLTYKFKLPDEQEDFTHAQKGIEYFSALSNFESALRRRIKDDQTLNEDGRELLERVRDEFYELTGFGLL